jgi:glycosyltransferase involved in cell wall biosynthesis
MSWSFPLTFAKRSVALIQFPSRDFRSAVMPRNWNELRCRVKNRLQRNNLKRYDAVVCYSEYVRRHSVQRLVRPDTSIIYPPFTPTAVRVPKEPIILGVGRFIETKRQDALVEAFRQLLVREPAARGWTLHLVGVEHRSEAGWAYVARIRAAAQDLPIVIHTDADLEALQDLYARASIFWHAAGFERGMDPAQQEHFGITTVEAMSCGCVPVVINLGGQPEIVEDGATGMLWDTLDELIRYTAELVESVSRREEMASRAVPAVERFGIERFRREVRDVVLPVPNRR